MAFGIVAGMEKRRGRPKRSKTDIFRTKVWYNAVSLRTGLTSYGLEKRFNPETWKVTDGKVIRPRKWDRYKKGTMTPSDKPGDDSLIDKVEKELPGTAYWFRHPVWVLLSTNQFSMEQLNGYQQKVGECNPAVMPFINELIDDEPLLGSIIPNHQACDKLFKIGGLDALAGSLILLYKGWLLDAYAVKEKGIVICERLQLSISDHNETNSITEELYRYIVSCFQEWVFLKSTKGLGSRLRLNIR